MLNSLTREFRFLRKDRGAIFWLALAFMLSVIAISFGISEVREQRTTIATLVQEDAADRANALSTQTDWGGAAYYAFHLTYEPPSDFAFAAMGQRDTSPWKHRIKMLALEGQIHEADTRNADFGLVGRFDFAFLAAAVAPLLLILLLYDLRASERTARRHDIQGLSGSRAPRCGLSAWPCYCSCRSGLERRSRGLRLALLSKQVLSSSAGFWFGG